MRRDPYDSLVYGSSHFYKVILRSSGGLRPGWQESYGRGSLSRALPEVARIKLNSIIPGQMIGLYIKNKAIWRKAKN
jgi:hypothetical protein